MRNEKLKTENGKLAVSYQLSAIRGQFVETRQQYL